MTSQSRPSDDACNGQCAGCTTYNCDDWTAVSAEATTLMLALGIPASEVATALADARRRADR